MALINIKSMLLIFAAVFTMIVIALLIPDNRAEKAYNAMEAFYRANEEELWRISSNYVVLGMPGGAPDEYIPSELYDKIAEARFEHIEFITGGIRFHYSAPKTTAAESFCLEYTYVENTPLSDISRDESEIKWLSKNWYMIHCL